MTILLSFLLFTVLQLATGFGLLTLFKIEAKPVMFLSLCLIAGTGCFAFVPFLLQLCYIPLTAINVFGALVFVCALLNIKWRRGIVSWRKMTAGWKLHIDLYELPILLVIGFMIFVSAWRCFYFPPFPRDLNSGAEVIAEYAVREKTMINSVFTVNLETTNNQFKPPFITSLQIIYKYAGFPFGQVWLIPLFIAFVAFLYQALSARIHKLIAGLLVVFFIAIPEMYVYTFMALFDYSNTVFFCIGVYFLIEWRQRKQWNLLAFAGLMMGFATYVRAETLILAFFLFPAILLHQARKGNGLMNMMKAASWWLLPSLFFYLLSITVYIDLYLPAHYGIGELMNREPWDLGPFFKRFSDMNSKLLFSERGVEYYGYFLFLFLEVLVVDLLFIRKVNIAARNWLYAILVIYAGLPLLGHLLPLMDLENTTKRGLFKLFPLLLLYMGESGVIANVSDRIKRWQEAS